MILTGDIITPRSGCNGDFSERKLYKVLSRVKLYYYDKDLEIWFEIKGDSGETIKVDERDFRPVSAAELWDYFVEGKPINVWERY